MSMFDYHFQVILLYKNTYKKFQGLSPSENMVKAFRIIVSNLHTKRKNHSMYYHYIISITGIHKIQLKTVNAFTITMKLARPFKNCNLNH